MIEMDLSSRIVRGRIDWMAGYGNRPHLEVELDYEPPAESFVYRKVEVESRDFGGRPSVSTLYFAELGGVCRFFSYSGPGRGYGGSSFTLNMQGGGTETLVGPWSSREGVMNLVGFGPCIECGRHSLLVSLVQDSLDLIEVPDYVDSGSWPRVDDPVRFPPGTRAGIVKTLRHDDQEPVWEPVAMLPDGTVWSKPGK